ncbi:MAG: 6-phosphogluconolactonase [Gallionella sp.]
MMLMNLTEILNAQVLLVCDDLDDLIAAVAQCIAELATQAITSLSAFQIALGGETPFQCYLKLRDLSINWPPLHIYFGGELCLPDSSSAHKQRSIVHHYCAILCRRTWRMLGMDKDVHTAGLFLGNPTINRLGRGCICTKPPAERVTMCMKTLIRARQKIFLVAGAGKRAVLEWILLGDSLPAASVTAAEWHFDRAALPGH